MRRALVFAVPLLALVLSACAGPLIPNTKIPNNKDTRAVLEVFSKYKTAFEALDAPAVIGLAAPTYFDKGDASKNTPPRDFPALQHDLEEDYKLIKSIKLDLTVKDVRVEDTKAEIDYFVVMHYMLQLTANTTRFPWKDEQDDARMVFVKVDGEWKVQTGL